MNSYFILLFVLRLSFGDGYVLIEGESDSVPKSSSEKQNPENIKKPLQDIETSGGVSVDEEEEKMINDFQDRITDVFVRMMEGNDDLYKDERIQSIINVLKSTMFTFTGEVDEDYIRKVVETYRKQAASKKKQLDEVDMNKLGFSSSDLQDFMEIVSADMKKSVSSVRSPRASEFVISK